MAGTVENDFGSGVEVAVNVVKVVFKCRFEPVVVSSSGEHRTTCDEASKTSRKLFTNRPKLRLSIFPFCLSSCSV